MEHTLKDEISSRHFPDVSDFSFQIPNVTDQTGDLLLAESEDFFKDADALITPIPTRTFHSAFTLSELTPKPGAMTDSSMPERSSPTLSQTMGRQSISRIPQSKKKAPRREKKARQTKTEDRGLIILPASDTSTTQRFENLQSQVESLVNENQLELPRSRVSVQATAEIEGTAEPQPVQEVHKAPRILNAKAKHVVKLDGVSKLQRHQEEVIQKTKPPQPTARTTGHAESVRKATATDTTDASMLSTVGGGAAEQLVSYGQKCTSAWGYLHHEEELTSENEGYQPTYVQPNVAVLQTTQSPARVQDPLTLSQISPIKVTTSTLAESNLPNPRMSPMRQQRKRPMATQPSDQQRKKGRKEASGPGLASANPLRHSKQENVAPTEAAHAIEPSSGKASKLKLSRVAHTRNGTLSSTNRRKAPDDSNSKSNRRPALSALHPEVSKPHHTSRARRPAIPFAKPSTVTGNDLNSSLETRRTDEKDVGGLSASLKDHCTYSVPDFKAIHAAQEAVLALRREQVTPVIPIPFEFNTTWRAKEREKFDEMIKEKQRENEKAMAQRRREQEDEEEKEVRESRKKTVPRAHEVPEWYKDAPRRRGNIDGGKA